MIFVTQNKENIVKLLICYQFLFFLIFSSSNIEYLCFHMMRRIPIWQSGKNKFHGKIPLCRAQFNAKNDNCLRLISTTHISLYSQIPFFKLELPSENVKCFIFA
jgi:hypothetical protein